MLFTSRGNFKMFVPVSSRYFYKHGPFAGENDVESAADSDDDELTEDEQDLNTEEWSNGIKNPYEKLAGGNWVQSLRR